MLSNFKEGKSSLFSKWPTPVTLKPPHVPFRLWLVLLLDTPSFANLSLQIRFPELSNWSKQRLMNVEFRWTVTYFWTLHFYSCRRKLQSFLFLWSLIGLLGAQKCPALHGLTPVLYFRRLWLFLCGLSIWILRYLHFNSAVDGLSPRSGQPLHSVWQILFYTNDLHHLKNTLVISLSD